MILKFTYPLCRNYGEGRRMGDLGETLACDGHGKGRLLSRVSDGLPMV